MQQPTTILPKLEYFYLQDPYYLNSIYQNTDQDYYWSDDFSPEFYAAQAKAGFMAVTEVHRGEELLLPELQKRYAVLDFADLHISKNVRKLISRGECTLKVGVFLDQVYREISRYHARSWLSKRYLRTLQEVNDRESGMTIVSVSLHYLDQITAGEIGYIIGSTYTSLSGFSSRDKNHRDNGTLQLVMLARWLEDRGFAFWNLGQPYMPYKFALGAKKYPRNIYLYRWLQAINTPLPDHVLD